MRCLRRKIPCNVQGKKYLWAGNQRKGSDMGSPDFSIFGTQESLFGQSSAPRSPPVNPASRGHPTITKILVALDPGTTSTKATYKIFFRGEKLQPQIGTDQTILRNLYDVEWPNHQHSVPTQIAFKRDLEIGCYNQIWGAEVTEALKDRVDPIVDPSWVFAFLKPALYGENGPLAPRLRDDIQKQIENLPTPIRHPLADQGQPGARELTCFDLYSAFLKHAWRHILRDIKDKHPQVPWSWADVRGTDVNGTALSCAPIELCIPLPADSTPHHVQMIVDAARRAGLPLPYTVVEPAAAYAFDLQQHTEAHGPVGTRMCSVVLDNGGGSVDLQAWSIHQTQPMQAKEEVRGEAAWCGGNFVNSSIRILVQKWCRSSSTSMETITAAISEARGCPITERQFLDEVVAEFEIKKKNFRHGQPGGLTLPIHGLPDRAASGMHHGAIQLEAEDVARCYDDGFERIRLMLNRMIERLSVKFQHSGGVVQNVREILLVGGGSASPYMKEKIRSTFDDAGGDFQIPVRTLGGEAVGTAQSIVRGALLLLMDKAFVHERVLRRGYAVKLDEHTSSNDTSADHLVEMEEHDGAFVRRDVTRFLLRIGDHVGHYHTAYGPVGCWRSLFLDKKRFLDDRRGRGWDCDEPVFFSDDITADGIWVNNPRYRDKIQPCGMLVFELSEHDCKDITDIRKAATTNRWYIHLEYRVEFIINGIGMTYRVVMPRDGKFKGDDYDPGDNPIIVSAQLICAGAFQHSSTT